jgi:hypothetical protein
MGIICTIGNISTNLELPQNKLLLVKYKEIRRYEDIRELLQNSPA